MGAGGEARHPGSVDALTQQRREWNARAISLALTGVSVLTAIALAVMPNASAVRTVCLLVGASAFANGLAYWLIRSGHLHSGSLLMIFFTLAQHTALATQQSAALVTPFFAALLVLIGATCLPSRGLSSVIGLAVVAVIAQWLVGNASGIDREMLRGATIGALVLVSVVGVVSWLNVHGLQRAMELAEAKENERELLSLQLEKSARMEALGRLAGGIAHDFNNLLVVIQGSAELASEDVDRDNPAQEELEQIQQASTRAAELTSQLLAFSRRQLVPPARLHLEKVVSDLEPLVQRLVGSHMKLELDIGQQLPEVMASRTQLEQVILNMAANARDATARGGVLTIRTLERELVSQDTDDLPPGRYVEIQIEDSGTGIPEEVMEHLFEPFFTTKEAGRGTGLGLATSFGIVNQMGGTITVDSEVGAGSTFHVYLPALDGQHSEQSEARLRAHKAAQKVLVVDDDPEVRKLVVRVLATAGALVLEAHNRSSSLEMSEQHPDLDLILMDVVLGPDDGLAVLDQLQAVQPDARLVVLSSFSPDKAALGRLSARGVDFLAKPFTNTQLLEVAGGVTQGASQSA